MADRINKTADQWTDEELIAWAKGEIKTGSKVSDSSVGKEATQRFGLEEGDVATVKEQLAAQATPEEPVEEEGGTEVAEEPQASSVSETGAMEEEASDPETTAPEASVPPTAEEDARVVNDAQTKPASEAPAPKLSPSRELFRDQLNRYVDAMSPGQVVGEKEGISNQVLLWRTIQNALNRQGSEFTSCFGEILEAVHRHRKGAFHERYVFRFWDALPLSTPERRNFERLLNLMMLTSDPATRAHTLRQVDMDATLHGFNDSDIHQKVVEFYSL